MFNMNFSDKKLFEDIFNMLSEAIWVTDSSGRVIEANKAAIDMMGRPKDKVIGRECIGKLKDICKSGRGCLLGEMIASGLKRRDVRLSIGNRQFHVRIYALGELFLHVARDITDEVKFHVKLVQAEKMAALGKMLSGISHELNNPLNAILGFSSFILEKDNIPDDKLREYISNIYEEAKKAANIVKALLVFSHEVELHREKVDVNEIIEGLVNARSYIYKTRKINVKLKLGNISNIVGDAHLIQQAILNILRNAEDAVEFTGSKEISIETYMDDDKVVISICDTGGGIPDDIMDNIFDPFFTTKAPDKGTGLGLSVVYAIVKEHDGEVKVKNRNGGACFEIRLPAYSDGGRAAETAKIFNTNFSFTGKRVLVTGDDVEVVNKLADVYKNAGIFVDLERNSLSGLSKVYSHNYDYVVCVCRDYSEEVREHIEKLVLFRPFYKHRIILVSSGNNWLWDAFALRLGIKLLSSNAGDNEFLEVIE